MRSRWLCLGLYVIQACGDSGSDDDMASSADTSATKGDTATGDDAQDDDADDDAPDDDAPDDDGPSDDDTGTDATDADTGVDATDDDGSTGTPGEVELPPPDGGLDYQLGGAYPPADGVTIVSRDRTEAPVGDGVYDICYVNGFQIQPNEEDFWLDEHPDLILRDEGGDPVIDQDWDEMLLDVSTPEKREAIAEIVGGWISGCGDAGFEAIEIDNLDSYSRSQDLLTQDNAVDFMVLLSASAHANGLAIAQKNSTELVPRRDEMGTDFVVSEECNTYEECGDYIDGYGEAVLMIEYVESDFDAGCAAYGDMSIVLRDVNLTTPDDTDTYVFEGC